MKQLILAISLMFTTSAFAMDEYYNIEDCLQMASVMQPEQAAKVYEALEAEGLLPVVAVEKRCDE